MQKYTYKYTQPQQNHTQNKKESYMQCTTDLFNKVSLKGNQVTFKCRMKETTLTQQTKSGMGVTSKKGWILPKTVNEEREKCCLSRKDSSWRRKTVVKLWLITQCRSERNLPQSLINPHIIRAYLTCWNTQDYASITV